MTKIELDKEISCVRALLERILRTMDEGLFVDYQMEKYGRIGYEVLPSIENFDEFWLAFCRKIREEKDDDILIEIGDMREEEK